MKTVVRLNGNTYYAHLWSLLNNIIQFGMTFSHCVAELHGGLVVVVHNRPFAIIIQGGKFNMRFVIGGVLATYHH